MLLCAVPGSSTESRQLGAIEPSNFGQPGNSLRITDLRRCRALRQEVPQEARQVALDSRVRILHRDDLVEVPARQISWHHDRCARPSLAAGRRFWCPKVTRKYMTFTFQRHIVDRNAPPASLPSACAARRCSAAAAPLTWTSAAAPAHSRAPAAAAPGSRTADQPDLPPRCHSPAERTPELSFSKRGVRPC